MRPKLWLSCGLLGVAAVCSTAPLAAEMPWKTEQFRYTAKDKDLGEFLREFGASQGLTVVIDKDVHGTVNGRFDLQPANFMDLMATSFGFIWFEEGNVLFVSPANDVRSEVIHLGNVNVSRLREALDQLNLPTARYPVIYDQKQQTAIVSGPNRYVDIVVKTAKSIDRPDGAAPSANAEIRVFPLKYAWAADFNYTQGGKDETIPGVASVLSQLYGRSTVPRISTRTVRAGRSPLEALQGLGMFGSGASLGGLGGFGGSLGGSISPTATSEQGGVGPIGNPLAGLGGDSSAQLPQFVADGRMNAVIVRDLPERMKANADTIKALDVKPGLVEIEVRIIEVNADAAESLGIDWRVHSSRVDLSFNRGNLPTLAWGNNGLDSLAVPDNGATSASGAVITTVLGDAGRFLLARVNALAQAGKANLLSSPKVLTLDNVEANLENLNTFFVKVAGNLDANLFDISVGTSLRVTPLIVNEGGKQDVKLAIRIEDGALTGQSVDNIPIVRRSSITTQSLLESGQALLIAGYAQEQDTDNKAGVPVLSEVPVLGSLFRYSDKRRTRVDRFFLLTPKVVKL